MKNYISGSVEYLLSIQLARDTKCTHPYKRFVAIEDDLHHDCVHFVSLAELTVNIFDFNII